MTGSMIEVVFEEFTRQSRTRRTGRLRLSKVDLALGTGSVVAREHGGAATPTLGFLLDGKKVRGSVSSS